jgi:histidinol-phosphate aminotransferase
VSTKPPPPDGQDSAPRFAAALLKHLRPDIVAMAGYTSGEQNRSCVKLNTNECPWPPSAAVKAALTQVVEDDLRLYPDPVANELRQCAAEAFGVTADQIMAGNGSDDCLTVIYRAFLQPGERVACPWPTYGLYETLAEIQGAELVAVDYLISDKDWALPANLARVSSKMVIIANPNNPSGTLVPVAQLRRLADQLDGVLVIDEAYVDFSIADGLEASMIPFLEKHPNVIVLRTFSKSFSLAGARLGLLFAQAPVIKQLMKVKDSYNVNAVTQRLGVAALKDRKTHLDQVRTTVTERKRMEEALARFGWTWPTSAANFLLCEVGPSAGAIYRGLKERNLLVRWWDKPALSTKLRITVGRPEHTDLLIKTLADVINSL